MKKLLLLFLTLCSSYLYAGVTQMYDFKVSNSDGVEIYYKITDATNLTVAVACEKMEYDDGDTDYTVPYTSLTTIVIPSTVNNPSNSKPYTVTSIWLAAFMGCSNLVSVELPETVTEIGNSAFSNCSKLETINLSNITKIGNEAFEKTGLTSVVIPAGVTTISEGAFSDCKKLASVKFHSGITEIGAVAFSGCSSLVSVELKYKAATKINRAAFKDCTSLKSFIAPTFSTSTGASSIFSGCTSLEAIVIDRDYAPTLNGMNHFDNVPTNCMLYVLTGGKSSFASASYWATFKNNIIEHEEGSYFLKYKKTGENELEVVYDYSDAAQDQTSITIPTTVSVSGTDYNVTSIGANAFEGFSALEEIYVSWETPVTLGTDAFKDISEDYVVNVPLTSYTSYKSATGWGDINLAPQSGTLALTDAAAYEIDKEVSGCEISYTRTVTTDNWMGVYLPFDVDVTAMDGKFATLTSIADGYINWTTQETGTIPACTPFIFKPTAAGTIVFSAESATLHACTEAHPVTSGGFTLAGNFTEITTMKTLGAYALSGNTFRQASKESQTLKPFRVFIVPTSPATAPPKLMNRINGENATGIDALTIDVDLDFDFDFDRAYNLSGQKVGAGYKGIVIENGHKVIRK